MSGQITGGDSGNLPHKSGKWLAGVTAEDPLSTAAEIAVSARLGGVAFYLPQAAYSASDDPVFVHQLRVASRRSAAALDAFGPCLPPRRGRKMGRRLRRIRRAAGAARDLDVLVLRLEKSDPGLSDAELDKVLAFLAREREAAQPPLVALAKKLPSKRLEKKISRLVRRIRWRGDGVEPTVFQAGQEHVRHVASEFNAASQATVGNSSIDALHQLRITGKQLRYTIELFACAAGEGLRRDVYPLVQELQDKLGAMNDHATAEQYFRESAQKTDRAGLKGSFNRLANRELHAIEQSVEAFRRWWSAARFKQIHSGVLEAFSPPSAA